MCVVLKLFKARVQRLGRVEGLSSVSGMLLLVLGNTGQGVEIHFPGSRSVWLSTKL